MRETRDVSKTDKNPKEGEEKKIMIMPGQYYNYCFEQIINNQYEKTEAIIKELAKIAPEIANDFAKEIIRRDKLPFEILYDVCLALIKARGMGEAIK